MKKIILMLFMMAAALPAFAVCSVTGGGMCSAYQVTVPTLGDKYLPNNITNIQKPTAFTPKYFAPFHSALINTETGGAAPGGEVEKNDYNSNCQFGVCLPGVNPSR